MTYIVHKKITSEKVKILAENDARIRNLLKSPQFKPVATIWDDFLPNSERLGRLLYEKLGNGSYSIWNPSTRMVEKKVKIG